MGETKNHMIPSDPERAAYRWWLLLHPDGREAMLTWQLDPASEPPQSAVQAQGPAGLGVTDQGIHDEAEVFLKNINMNQWTQEALTWPLLPENIREQVLRLDTSLDDTLAGELNLRGFPVSVVAPGVPMAMLPVKAVPFVTWIRTLVS
ncbi:hypothetical protein [Kineosporia babensis]|uniref:Uncharacterized protein n=1 Tax=Kineosporia babensis TaxID=499548 RepID=A0A9X1NL77_9ACTN|nr:hypothetical protein [Kineosporia babensis]MCD5316145.1 hypothetical protein [Kineosporia babensis]